MNSSTVIILAIVAACVFLALRSLRKKGGCGCGSCCNCRSGKNGKGGCCCGF